MRILVVEDEHKIANSIKKGLEQESFAVDVAFTGPDGFDLASSENYDLIVLDIMLPQMSGIEICKKLRGGNIHTPILMLTAKGQTSDKVEGLNSGADDYLTKPFAFEELLARVKALSRRPKISTGSTYKVEVMIMFKKKVFFPVLALAIIASALIGSRIVLAQDVTFGGHDSLISKIAQKFNLNEADVKAVFEEEKAQREVEMKAEMEKKLTEAVQNGKITEAQKKAIQEKFAQPFAIKFKATAGQAISEEDVLKIKEEKKAEMDTWLSQNGLTHEILREVMGHPKGFGPGKRVLFMAH